MKVFIVYCHPSEDSFTKNMCDEFIRGITDSGNGYIISDLYKMGFHADMTEEEYLRDANYYNDVSKLADQLYSESESETEFVKMAYEYVRDMISHSADISADTVTCSASEVLKAGHGICFAKAHLLAAILRSKSVPPVSVIKN